MTAPKPLVDRTTGSPIWNGRLTALVRDFSRHVPQLSDVAQPAATGFLQREEVRRLVEGKPPDSVDQAEAVIHEIVGLCVVGRLQPLLAAYGIPNPPYNFLSSFLENDKPWAPPSPGRESAPGPSWRLLGHEIGFPIGVPSSVLTANSLWIDYYAQRGFNVLTYKTVRSRSYEAHPTPNWVFLPELTSPLELADLDRQVFGDSLAWPSNPTAFSMANSFGVPSTSSETWQRDVAAALSVVATNQILIVSVMGFHEELSGRELIDDFVSVARMAESTGAPAVELNLSCPNTIDPAAGGVKREFLCESAKDTQALVAAVRDALDTRTRLVVKFARLPLATLEDVIVPLAEQKLIDGVSGINTIQMEIIDRQEAAVFPPREGASRLVAGVSGIAIREFGMKFARDVASLRAAHRLDFDLIAMGGVMDAIDVDAYLAAGADAVQVATGAFLHPDLALTMNAGTPTAAPLSEVGLRARAKILELLDSGPKPLDVLADELGEEAFPASEALREKTHAILGDLQAKGLVVLHEEEGRLLFAASAPAPRS
jgi:dihydroorotate dehydrogenase